MHRRRASLSQERLAENAGLSAKAIGALESGRRRAPYRATVSSLGRALGLNDGDQAIFDAAAAHARLPSVSTHGSLPSRLENLPAAKTSFVGRKSELQDLSRLLEQHRLLTVTGSGGLGKTRLAIAAGSMNKQAYADGVWLAELASVSDAPSVVGKIAAAVGITLADGAQLESLSAQLGSRNLLLILDNCEHVIAYVLAAVAAILRACPRVSVMATSRERLALYGEVTYRVPSLPVPPLRENLMADEAHAHAAVQLFVDRAQMADPRFEFSDEVAAAVADICRKLDGIPFAIEIAAARLPYFGLLNLRRKLDDRLNPLTNAFVDSPARQRTLSAMLDWSYNLLDVSERALFRRISIFPGGCIIQGAEAVSAGFDGYPLPVSTLLTSLVDKSLLTIQFSADEVRYSFLESTREFAIEKLRESGEFALVSDQLLSWATAFGDAMRSTEGRVSISEWFARTSAEFDNVYAALSTLLVGGRNVLAAGKIFGHMRVCWLNLGRFEAERIATTILSQLDSEQHPGVAAALQMGLANLSIGPKRIGALCAARVLLTRADDASGLIRCYLGLSWAYVHVGNLSEASNALDNARKCAALAGMDNSQIQAQCLWIDGVILNWRGDVSGARELLRLGAEIATALEDHILLHLIGVADAETYFCSGDALKALSLFEELLDEESSYPEQQPMLWMGIASCLIALGDVDAGRDAARFGLRHAAATELQVIYAIFRFAHIKSLGGEPVPAARLFGHVERWMTVSGMERDPFERTCYEAFMRSLSAQLDAEEVRRHQSDGQKMSLDDAVSEALAP